MIIIKRLKDANLFMSQGGLIILAQVSQSKLLWQPLLLKVSFWPVWTILSASGYIQPFLSFILAWPWPLSILLIWLRFLTNTGLHLSITLFLSVFRTRGGPQPNRLVNFSAVCPYPAGLMQDGTQAKGWGLYYLAPGVLAVGVTSVVRESARARERERGSGSGVRCLS